MLEEQDETLLARWLSGTLTPEEQQALETSEAFSDYLRIVQSADRFQKPSFNKDAFKAKLLSQLDTPKKGRVIPLKTWYYAAAATVLILLSLGLFFNEVTYTTAAGEQQTVALPDGSTVHLNADSHLNRSRFFWLSDRKLHLVHGEGFFEVTQGDGFEVATASGIVRVLGTTFNIKTRPSVFEVSCFEGKVQFEEANSENKIILTQGQELRQTEESFNRDTIVDTAPAWLKGQSIFRNAPLFSVLQELEIQFGIKIEAGNIPTTSNFTGGFIHTDLETALTAVLVPMGIAYTLSDDKKTVILTVTK
ncbi:FecR domain-containing protein [Arenibacter sp. GZD96]|uniref:FecR family protein n=1 Tax=Aurantibrevibacter litoralis TaxID=3106030 RepID=UPI002AFF5C40|nr:FecR domain-containing protein [Arenibacter sp. GZD-96]MEA1786524.1 FecR domain-containing protein [Arenibacter sp. GZD-96]